MQRGPLWMILATLAFTVMIALVQIARQELSAFEVMFWRGVTSVPLAFAMVVASRPRQTGLGESLRVNNPRLLLARIALGASAMACFFTAAKGLSLGDLTLIGKLQPIVVALLAPMALGASERSDRFVWLTLAGGIVGSAILIAPELAVGNEFGLFALVGAGFSAGAHVAVRGLGRTDRPTVVVFWFQVGVLTLSTVAIVAEHGALTLPPTDLWPHVLGCGIAATIGQLFMTRAYALDSAPRVAAASYTGPIWAVLADLTIYALWPSPHAIVGGTLIVAAGMGLLLRSRAEPRPATDG